MKTFVDPPMILRSTDSTRVVRATESFHGRVGWSFDELQAHPLEHWIHPEDFEALESAITGGAGRATARHRTKSGEFVALEWEVRTHDGEGVVLGIDRPSIPKTQPPPTATAQASRAELSETLDAMVRIVEAKNPGLRCSILLVDAERTAVTVGAGPSLPARYNDAVEGLKIGPTVGSCGTAAFWNVPVVVDDISKDPLWVDLRSAAKIAGVEACWSQPVHASNGDVLGAMALYATEPRTPTEEQMGGLEVAARMVGLAIERDGLEQQLRQAAKLEALGVLAGGIAHDFNNLLATILGNAELIEDSLSGSSDAVEGLQSIIAASLSAKDLCKQMSDFAGQGSVSTEALDCNALVRELGGLLQVALSKKAEFGYELHGGALGLRADRSQLSQVLMNLVTNASEALGNEEGRITISTDLESVEGKSSPLDPTPEGLPPGTYVRIRVRDTGCGMCPATQRKIFDPFFTTKSVGRGLGLAAVRGIIARHGGTIHLESEVGRGTTFTVLLPHVPARDSDVAAELEADPAWSPAHILVVDDEPAVLKVYSAFLERAGYTVSSASDGPEAIQLLQSAEFPIDLVLLDLSMPRLDGEETLRRLRGIRPDLRVVLCSGSSEHEIARRFEGTRLDGIVRKPTQRNELLEAVAAALPLDPSRADRVSETAVLPDSRDPKHAT